MRNVNLDGVGNPPISKPGFILTMRNVNWDIGGESKPLDGVLY